MSCVSMCRQLPVKNYALQWTNLKHIQCRCKETTSACDDCTGVLVYFPLLTSTPDSSTETTVYFVTEHILHFSDLESFISLWLRVQQFSKLTKQVFLIFSNSFKLSLKKSVSEILCLANGFLSYKLKLIERLKYI